MAELRFKKDCWKKFLKYADDNCLRVKKDKSNRVSVYGSIGLIFIFDDYYLTFCDKYGFAILYWFIDNNWLEVV